MPGGIEFSDVARLLTCEQFARRELAMRGNRAKCPFHHGANFNLAFFPDGRCHCFKCNRTADSVQLASATWNMNQLDAARLLNDEFSLGLAAEMPSDEQREQRRREADRRDRERDEARKAWATACDEEREAAVQLERFTVDDADKPEFAAALKRLCDAQTKCDLMWAEQTGVTA